MLILRWDRPQEGPQEVFRDPGFPLLEARDSGFFSKTGQDSGLKVCARVRMPEISLGVTELHEIFGLVYGIEEPYWVASHNTLD